MTKYTFKIACYKKTKNIIVVNIDANVKECYEIMLGSIIFNKFCFDKLLMPDNYKNIVTDKHYYHSLPSDIHSFVRS